MKKYQHQNRKSIISTKYWNQMKSKNLSLVNQISPRSVLLLLFSLAATFYRSRRTCLCMESSTCAARFCSSHIRSIHLTSLLAHSFPSTHSLQFQNIQLSLDHERTFFIYFFLCISGLVDLKYWGCLCFRSLCSQTLFTLCLFHIS